MFSETKIIVRYAETDKMGIAHHSVYPIWYEVARTEAIKKIGISYSEMEKLGIMTPLTELNCKYILPAEYEDELLVQVAISKLTPARVIFEYKVYKERDNILINTGSTMHAFVGLDLKPLNLKKHFPEIYEKINNLVDVQKEV